MLKYYENSAMFWLTYLLHLQKNLKLLMLMPHWCLILVDRISRPAFALASEKLFQTALVCKCQAQKNAIEILEPTQYRMKINLIKYKQSWFLNESLNNKSLRCFTRAKTTWISGIAVELNLRNATKSGGIEPTNCEQRYYAVKLN